MTENNKMIQYLSNLINHSLVDDHNFPPKEAWQNVKRDVRVTKNCLQCTRPASYYFYTDEILLKNKSSDHDHRWHYCGYCATYIAKYSQIASRASGDLVDIMHNLCI
jgi:hypothetical protein